jgi:hypothetical protein
VVVVERLLDAADAALFKGSIRQLQEDFYAGLYEDAYTCWTVNRDAGWEDSDAVETQVQVETGIGKLRANGPGGPQGEEGIIHLASPYRLRTLTTSLIEPGHLLVINGDRKFRVDAAKREHAADYLMDVYLTELFATPMPGGG